MNKITYITFNIILPLFIGLYLLSQHAPSLIGSIILIFVGATTLCFVVFDKKIVKYKKQ